jgi:phytanoyl-CoA hydroxylase
MRQPAAGEIASYREQGFAVLDGFLTPDECARWRAACQSALEDRGDRRLPRAAAEYDAFFQQENEYYNRVFRQCINLWMTSDAVRDLVLDPGLGRAATALAGTAGMRIWLDQALVKGPFAHPTSYHLDVPYWSFTSTDALTIWIALDDATMANGCLCYLPGTHRDARTRNVEIGPEIGALFDVYPAWRAVDPVFCPVPAGSAVVHNGLIAHGAGANMTPHRRFAMTIAFMPDGSTFNGQQDILPQEYAATLRPGDVLDNGTFNPLVYRHAR